MPRGSSHPKSVNRYTNLPCTSFKAPLDLVSIRRYREYKCLLARIEILQYCQLARNQALTTYITKVEIIPLHDMDDIGEQGSPNFDVYCVIR